MIPGIQATMSAFTKSSILLLFVILLLVASGCTRRQRDGGSSGENGTDSGSGSLPFTSDGPSIRTIAEVASELETGDGNMVPLFESVPNLLAEYIGQDTKKLATLNEQLRKTNNERTKIGNAKPDEESVESGGDEETQFQLGDLGPAVMAFTVNLGLAVMAITVNWVIFGRCAVSLTPASDPSHVLATNQVMP